LAKGRWPQSEFIALRFHRRQDHTQAGEQLETLGATLVEIFSQPSGDTVIVYRLP
jgi:hypothetical protein